MLPAQIPAPAPEVAALGIALNDFLAAIKSGKSVAEAAVAIEGDALTLATSGISKIGADISMAHNQAYLAFSIASVYEAP